MNAPTDYQLAVLDGLLRAEETGVPYPWHDVPRPTRAALERAGWVAFARYSAWWAADMGAQTTGAKITDTGRALVIGWRLGQKKRRRCA